MNMKRNKINSNYERPPIYHRHKTSLVHSHEGKRWNFMSQSLPSFSAKLGAQSQAHIGRHYRSRHSLFWSCNIRGLCLSRLMQNHIAEIFPKKEINLLRATTLGQGCFLPFLTSSQIKSGLEDKGQISNLKLY